MFTFVHRAQCFKMSPQSKLCLHFAATCLPTLVSCIREYKLRAVKVLKKSVRSLGYCFVKLIALSLDNVKTVGWPEY